MNEARKYEAMLLLSTLSTAAEVWHTVKERHAGRDPSAQESPRVVHPLLHAARKELQEMTMRLRASLVYTTHYTEETEEQQMAHAVRRFDDLMTLNRVTRLLHVVHQRLLSLYPDVSEDLVEEARRLEGRCGELVEADDEIFEAQLGAFLEQVLVFTAGLHRELA